MRQIVLSTKTTLLDERHRVLRSSVKDILPTQENIHGAVIEGCLFLLRLETNGGGIPSGTAAISALRVHLHRSYNDQTVLEATCFAEGFLDIGESLSQLSRVKEVRENHDPNESWDRKGLAYLATDSYSPSSRVGTQEVKMQSPQRLMVAGSLLIATTAVALLGVTTLKVLDANKGSDGGNKEELDNSDPQRNTTYPDSAIKNRSLSSNAVHQPQSTMADLGYAVGGQKLLLDLASIKPYPNSANISFRYSLGNESIDSVADCGRREWMTLPEKEWHLPQSTATERMLSRLCEAFEPEGPEISSSGAAIVYDPPSNIRTTPNGGILCSITSKGTIPIQRKRGDWYETNYCGSPGYIHKGQLRF